jgi:hypothetical protein
MSERDAEMMAARTYSSGKMHNAMMKTNQAENLDRVSAGF